ncbi:hypothetical protein PLEOSDRAFT_1102483 [Pleurotus ostreatus PC15]|uniref:Uncharacterized protein n=1 Tax=Pleurotus ostreatus (strain PC15) TaxID=1137138 RepID=A0A067NWZ8_PLEO1|nr:hypothetical protein PLEOSDRAFT_1102483 [Pleurotus ostreatus PC15]
MSSNSPSQHLYRDEASTCIRARVRVKRNPVFPVPLSRLAIVIRRGVGEAAAWRGAPTCTLGSLLIAVVRPRKSSRFSMLDEFERSTAMSVNMTFKLRTTAPPPDPDPDLPPGSDPCPPNHEFQLPHAPAGPFPTS